MNRYKLFNAGIDTNEGIRRFNGNAEAYEKYLYRFDEDGFFSEMCAAIEAGDVKAAFEAAHALKGICGNLSMNALHEDIVPLVEQLRAGSLEHTSRLLESVSADYQKVVCALQDKE